MTSALARKFALDVAFYVPGVLPAAAAGYTRFRGINDFDPQTNPTNQDVSDYDSDGWSTSEKTMNSAVWSAKARRPFDAGIYDPGQEIVHAAQTPFGDSGKVFARYFDRNGGTEAKAGVFLVDWSQDKSGVADVETVAVKLTGVGKIYDITNPYQAVNAPTIQAITPAGKGTGQTVAITGSGFTGATPAVLFAATLTGGVASGTAATDFSVLSDALIIATLPTGTAGNTAVAVKTTAGSSGLYTYLRAA